MLLSPNSLLILQRVLSEFIKKDLIRQLFSEEIMRESVIYQDILEEGKREEALTYTMRLLKRRLVTVEPELEQQISRLSITQLENLGEALLDFSSPADLVTWLQANNC